MRLGSALCGKINSGCALRWIELGTMLRVWNLTVRAEGVCNKTNQKICQGIQCSLQMGMRATSSRLCTHQKNMALKSRVDARNVLFQYSTKYHRSYN